MEVFKEKREAVEDNEKVLIVDMVYIKRCSKYSFGCVCACTERHHEHTFECNSLSNRYACFKNCNILCCALNSRGFKDGEKVPGRRL